MCTTIQEAVLCRNNTYSCCTAFTFACFIKPSNLKVEIIFPRQIHANAQEEGVSLLKYGPSSQMVRCMHIQAMAAVQKQPSLS